MTQQQVRIGVESKTFDNFALSCFRNCPTYYDWRIVKGVVKPGAKKTAADFGTCIHMALEHYYSNGMTDVAIQEAMELFAKEFVKHQDDADDKRTIGKGLEILANYFKRYKHEAFNVVAIEVGGAVEIGAYLYTVRIDLVAEWISPKGIYGFDHKTTSSLGRMVAKPNNQITGYDFTLKEQYSNVLGFQLNVIGVYKETEEMDKGAPKVVSPKTGKLIYAKKERETLIRMPTSRTLIEIEDWKKETIHLIHQIEECQEKDVWPKHSPEFCTAFATRCQYLDLCQAQDKSILKPLLEAEVYLIEAWTPYISGEIEGGEEE